MSQPFAVFDIDGTLIRWQLYHAIADALVRLGFMDKETFEVVRQARMDWKRRIHQDSFKDYEMRLVQVYEQVLTSLSVDRFEDAIQAVFDEYKDQAYTYTRDLIESLKKKGYLLFAISNSQTEIVKKITKYYNFNDFVGAEYERKNGKFTGKVTVHLSDKDQVLRNLVKKHGCSWKGSLAIGDGASDIPMLKIVESPIAFNPEKKLYDEAINNNWPVVIERKNVIYKLRPKDGKYVLA